LRSQEQIIRDLDRDNFMSAQEACDYGLIDKVVEVSFLVSVSETRTRERSVAGRGASSPDRRPWPSGLLAIRPCRTPSHPEWASARGSGGNEKDGVVTWASWAS
jgi:hypothetical protein